MRFGFLLPTSPLSTASWDLVRSGVVLSKNQGPENTHKHKIIFVGTRIWRFTGGSRPQPPSATNFRWAWAGVIDDPGSEEYSFICHAFIWCSPSHLTPVDGFVGSRSVWCGFTLRQRGHEYHAQPPSMKSPAAFTAQWGPAWAVTNICALTRAAYFVAGRLPYHVFGQFQGLPWCWPKLAEEPTGSTTRTTIAQ